MSEQVQHTPTPWVVRELVDVVQRLLDERDKMKDTWEMDHLWEAAETLLTKLRGDTDAQ